MSIRYEGRYPDIDFSVANKQWADDTIAATAVDAIWIGTEVSRVVENNALQTITYVDSQDLLLAKIADVAAADNNHVDASARNVTVVPLNSAGQVNAAQLPTLPQVERAMISVTGAAVFTGSVTATSTETRERRLATLTIPDPGYPYLPLPFGQVAGQAGGTPPVYPWTGNGICGQLTVCPPQGSGNTIYGIGVGTDTATSHLIPVVPYAASLATPLNRPPVTGPLTLDLYGCCFNGAGYNFTAAGLVFYVLVVPA